jgi:hypothetical protein
VCWVYKPQWAIHCWRKEMEFGRKVWRVGIEASKKRFAG